jgi:hypothetical protein
MNIIKLTLANNNEPVYINIDHIGHFFKVPAKKEYGKETQSAHIQVGVTTHNNGGFKIAEDCNQIFKMIEKAKQ